MPKYRAHIVDATDNSNIRTEDVEAKDGEDPGNLVELGQGEIVGAMVPLAERQSADD